MIKLWQFKIKQSKMVKMQGQPVLEIKRSNLRLSSFVILTLIFICSCNQTVDKALVLRDLKDCYYENKNTFDSLGVKLTDTNFRSIEIKLAIKNIQLKNSKGYDKLALSDNITSDDKKTFIVKELGYGISCGFFYLINGNKDYFENSRLTYKKIAYSWYAYIYFN